MIAWMVGVRPIMRLIYMAYQAALLAVRPELRTKTHDFHQSRLARVTVPLQQLGCAFLQRGAARCNE